MIEASGVASSISVWGGGGGENLNLNLLTFVTKNYNITILQY